MGAAAHGLGGGARVTRALAGITLTLSVTEGSSRSPSASENTGKNTPVTALTNRSYQTKKTFLISPNS